MVNARFYWRKARKQRRALEQAQQERDAARQLLEDARLAAETQVAVYKEQLASVTVCCEAWQGRSQRYKGFIDDVIQNEVLSPIRDGHTKGKMVEKLRGKATAAGCKLRSLLTGSSSK